MAYHYSLGKSYLMLWLSPLSFSNVALITIDFFFPPFQGKWEVPVPKVRAQGETEVLKVIRTGKRKKKAWKRMVTKVCFVGDGFTRKPPKYERFIRPMVMFLSLKEPLSNNSFDLLLSVPVARKLSSVIMHLITTDVEHSSWLSRRNLNIE